VNADLSSSEGESQDQAGDDRRLLSIQVRGIGRRCVAKNMD